MKKTSIILTLAAIAMPWAAHAQDENNQKQRNGKKMRAKLIEQFDADGDGKLDETERAAAKSAMKERRAEFIARHDTDGDGKLSDEEKQAAKEAFLAKYDTDGDGKLSADERQLARDAGEKFPMHRKKKCNNKGGGDTASE
ncbi:hypothetical protein [Rubritalea marina]|uniref:hypothetical protein n=1 Tax=Rubritalea marina TaxID=361055 RepID=UPI0003624BFD|nr:hypothetical protein [Rubritalea marina]